MWTTWSERRKRRVVEGRLGRRPVVVRIGGLLVEGLGHRGPVIKNISVLLLFQSPTRVVVGSFEWRFFISFDWGLGWRGLWRSEETLWKYQGECEWKYESTKYSHPQSVAHSSSPTQSSPSSLSSLQGGKPVHIINTKIMIRVIIIIIIST